MIKWIKHTFAIVVFGLGIAYSAILFSNYYAWFEWWRGGAEPMSFSGIIEDVYYYKGRNKGEKRVKINTSSGYVLLNTYMPSSRLNKIVKLDQEMVFSYILIPTSERGWVHKIESGEDRKLYYYGELFDKDWVLFLAILLPVFLLSLNFFLVYLYVRHDILKKV